MRFNERSSTKVLEYMITKPNEYIGQNSYIETGLFKYNSNYEIARKVGSTTVYAGSEHEAGSIFNYGQIGYNTTNSPRIQKVQNLRSHPTTDFVNITLEL